MMFYHDFFKFSYYTLRKLQRCPRWEIRSVAGGNYDRDLGAIIFTDFY